MSGSISPIPNLSYAARLRRRAEAIGFKGEGAVNLVVQSSNGVGAINVVVSAGLPASVPTGTIVLDATTGAFSTNTGIGTWEDLGNNPDLDALAAVGFVNAVPVRLPKLPVVDANPQPVDDTSIISDAVVTTNSESGVISVTNGELTLMGGARYYSDHTPIVPNGERNYSVNVANSLHTALRDWSYLFSVELTDTTNAPGITDLYDVSLVIENIDTGKRLNFVGTFDGSAGEPYDFVFNDIRRDFKLVLPTDENGAAVAELARASTLNAKLLNVLSVANGAPIGNYRFTLTAVRSRGDFAPLICSWTVAAIDSDMSIIKAITTASNSEPHAIAKKANGQLLFSSGNVATNMQVVGNGEIELAGAVRYYRSSLPALTGPTYSLNVQDSNFAGLKDWVWVYSLALLDKRNGQSIDEIYDLSMTVTSESGEVVFVGAYEDGVFHLRDNTVLDIVDNQVNEFDNAQVVQNIQRVRFYAEYLLPEIGEHSGSPVGEYEFEIRARRKIGDVPDVVCAWTANAIDFVPPPPEPEPEPEPEIVEPAQPEDEGETEIEGDLPDMEPVAEPD